MKRTILPMAICLLAACFASTGVLAQLAAPTQITAPAWDHDRILARWDTVLGADGYRIYTSTDGVTFTLAADVAGEAAEMAVIDNLTQGTNYTLEVEAYNSNFTSARSNVQRMTATKAMVHDFRLDTLAGAALSNTLGGPDAMLMGTGQILAPGASGLPFPALKLVQDPLQAIDSWVRFSPPIAGSGLLPALMSRSVSLWFRNDQPSLYSVLVSFGKRTGLTIAFKNDSLFVATKHRIGSPWYDAMAGAPFSGNQWNHLAYVYRDPMTTVYLNGVELFSFDGTGEWPYPGPWTVNGPGDNSYEFGAQEDPDFTTQKRLGDNFDVGARNFFYGDIARFKTYNYNLSPAEVMTLYAEGLPAAPTNFRWVAKDIDRMYLAWNTVTDAEGYIVSVSSDSVTYTPVDTLAGQAVGKYIVDGLMEGATYHFRVQAYTSVGPGPFASLSAATGSKEMVHHFPLDSVVNGKVRNLLGAVDGDVMGQVSVVAAGASGLPVGAVKFNQDELQGVQSWIRLTEPFKNNSLATSLMSRTVTFWFKNDQPSLFSVLASFGKPTGLTVAFKNDSIFVATKHRIGSPWYDAIAGRPFNNTDWHYLAYVYRDPITSVYLDGAFWFSFDGSAQWPHPGPWQLNNPGDNSYEIGGQEDPDFTTQKHLGDNFDVGIRNLFYGEMAQLKTWNYARSSADILAEFTDVFPAAPANFRVVARDIDRMYFAWDAVPTADGYTLEVSEDGTTFTEVANIPDGTANKLAIDGLEEQTAYTFKITSYITAGKGLSASLTDATLEPRMIHHFPLDAIVGDSVINVLGGKGGKVVGQVTVVDANTTGLPVPAVRFNQDELQGIQSWIRLSDALNQNAEGLDAPLMSRTVSFWMKNDAPTLFTVPLSFGKRTGLTVACQNENLYVATKQRVGSPWYDAIGNTPYTQGTDWVFFTYVYRDPITTVYLNGDSLFSFDGSNEWPYPQRWLINGPGDRSFEIGGQEDPDFTTQKHLGDNFDVGIRNLFIGEMSQLKTWNYARSAESIKADYEQLVSVEKVQSGVFQVYPNPVNDVLNVVLEPGQLADMALFTIDGRLAKRYDRQSSGSLSVADLPPGIYFLRAQAGNRQQTSKVVVFR